MLQRSLAFTCAAVALALTACTGNTAPTTPIASGPVKGLRPHGGSCKYQFYPPVGSGTPSNVTPQGPGIIMGGGGTDVDAGFVWMHDTIAGSPAGNGGDIVILRSTGTNAYDSYIYGLAKFNSVRTLLLPTCTPASILQQAATIVNQSEGVFFAGGNQADYISSWTGTPLATAVQNLYNRGGVVGGTSAGDNVLPQYIFDAIAERNKNVYTADAVANPYEATISFSYDFLNLPILQNVMTDPHFVTRDRFGRFAAFLARQFADGKDTGSVIHGVGIDEKTDVVVDKNGVGTLLLQGTGGSAYFLSAGPAQTIAQSTPLVYDNIQVTRLGTAGQTFNFKTWCAAQPTYTVNVNGNNSPIYAPNPPYTPPPSAIIPACH
ncbi:MAG TPA: cyanophycinase [Candidatus Baltobacteraceae bacterium]|nr:cyanophycinase [Candidatus Baltobacteraceae bacterium]